MNIYFAHKKEINPEIFKALEQIETHRFIFPHANPDTFFDSKTLFESKRCDSVVAEVSEPSTGVGIELGWANNLSIPIICIYRTGSRLANSLKIVSNKFIEYTDLEDLKIKLTKELK